MATTTTTLVSVEPSPDGKKPWLLRGSDGAEFKTFNAELGRQALAMIGHPVQIGYTLQQREFNGKMYTNFMIDSFSGPLGTEVGAALAGAHAAQASVPTVQAALGARPFVSEPAVNTAKQIVIIRQSSWSTAQRVYDTAVELYKQVYPTAEKIDMHAVHSIAWLLIGGTEEKHTAGGMGAVARFIEHRVREGQFSEPETTPPASVPVASESVPDPTDDIPF